MEVGESIESATIREVKEETNIDLTRSDIDQFRVYSDPQRDQRRHTVSDQSCCCGVRLSYMTNSDSLQPHNIARIYLRISSHPPPLYSSKLTSFVIIFLSTDLSGERGVSLSSQRHWCPKKRQRCKASQIGAVERSAGVAVGV